MKVRLIFSAVLLGLLLAVVDQYFKNHSALVSLNTGSVLGLPLANSLVILLHTGVIAGGIILLVMKVRKLQWLLLVSVMLTVSLSNLCDRILLGHVVDYIYIAGIWFNLADAIITVGILVICYKLIKE